MNVFPTSTDNPRAVGGRCEAIASASTDCPNFSVLTAFVENRLRGTDRDAIVRHLMQCEACYFTVNEAARLSSASSVGLSRWTAVSTWASAAVVALAVATTALAVGSLSTRRMETKPANPVASATNALGHSSSSSSVLPVDACADPQVREHDLGLARVLAAYQASVEDTGGKDVKAKYSPTDAVGANASSENVRAALYLDRWRRTRHLEDAAGAFDAATSAVGSDPHLIEAQFNLALALEAISTSFGDESRHAWERYLTIDSTSSRAAEAKIRLAKAAVNRDKRR
jgi:hypothetical protein